MNKSSKPDELSSAQGMAALAYREKGWAVIDLPYGEKNPGRLGWQRERWSEEQIRERFAEPRNPAILLGEASHIIDVDLDYVRAGLCADAELPVTPAVFGRASKRRSHRLYRSAEPFRRVTFTDPLAVKEGGLGLILEVRGTGCLTVLPGGIHGKTGEPIVWESEGEPAEVKVEELVAECGRYAAMLLLASRLQPSSRHDLILPLAGGLLRSGWQQEQVEEFCRRINRISGGDFEDWRKAIDSTAQKLANGEEFTGWPTLADAITDPVVRAVKKWLGVRDSSDRPKLTDLGNSQRLVERHGANLRFCGAWQKWLIWDGLRWTVDDTGQVYRWAKETVRAIYDEAREEPDPEASRLIGRWAANSQSVNRIEAMVRLARSDEEVVVRPTDLDSDPWLLNLKNGTLDLATGELRPWRREDHITKLAPVGYDPDATCPLWEAFVLKAMGDNTELVKYLQRLVGYMLTGDTREKAAPIVWGDGDTGKTTFTETLLALLGDDFAMVAPEATVAAKKNGGGIPNDLARLKGARLVVVSETAEGMLLDEARVKALTGRNKISVRFLHAEWFDYIPEFKLLIETNNKPRIRESGTAIWNRVKLIPFLVVIPSEEQDKELGRKFLAELSGILTWAVEGCRQWQVGGLADPQEVKAATQAFRIESDLVGEFLDEMTVADPGAHTSTSALYTAFKSWVINERGSHPVNQQTFNERVESKGFKKTRVSTYRWNGLRMFMVVKTEGGPDP